MAREYRRIKQYEKEMLEMKASGMTNGEIGEQFGLTYEQVHDFFKRYNRKQRAIAAGQPSKKQGRPSSINVSEKYGDKYVIDRLNTRIKRLEMENELMRDFLSLTERK